jgi:hypothetical protein
MSDETMSTAEAVETGRHREETTTETESADEQVEQAELSKDDLFHILQNQRRRRVLKYLQDVDEDEQVDMRDIAEQVAAWEHDTTLQQLTSDERQRVYIALYQSHLPKLDEKGIIDYNQSRGFVTQTPLADQFEHYLTASSQEESAETSEGDAETTTASSEETDTTSMTPTDSARYYSGATAVGLALTAMSWGGVAPTALSSYLATFITGMFLFITVGVAYQNRQ